MIQIRLIKPTIKADWQTEFNKLFQEVDDFSWNNMYDKNRRTAWWIFPGRIGQDQPRGHGTFEDILVSEDTRTSQVHVTALMRFIRQSERILEGKYVTEEIVAKWCQLQVNQPPNTEAQELAVQLIQHAFRILERFYNGEDIVKDPDVAMMILNSTYYRSAVVGNQSNQSPTVSTN